MGSKVCKVLNAKWHLLCYPVSQTPVISPVFDQNHFVTSPPGGVPVTIEHTTFLCVPVRSLDEDNRRPATPAKTLTLRGPGSSPCHGAVTRAWQRARTLATTW